jgi:hypothetical protein
LCADPCEIEANSAVAKQPLDVDQVLSAKEHHLQHCEGLGTPDVDVLLFHPHVRPSRTGDVVEVEHRQKDVDVDSATSEGSGFGVSAGDASGMAFQELPRGGGPLLADARRQPRGDPALVEERGRTACGAHKPAPLVERKHPEPPTGLGIRALMGINLSLESGRDAHASILPRAGQAE